MVAFFGKKKADNANAENDRLRITLALSKTLSREQVRLAMELYPAAIAANGGLDAKRFVEHIAQTVPGASGQYAAIYHSLTGETGNQVVKPSAGLAAHMPTKTSADTEEEHRMAVFNMVINSVAVTVNDGSDDIVTPMIDDVINHLSEHKVATTTVHALRQWATTVKAGQPVNINRRMQENVMIHVVDAMYGFCCEEFGPRSADRIFADAIENAESTKSGRRYSPRNLF